MSLFSSKSSSAPHKPPTTMDLAAEEVPTTQATIQRLLHTQIKRLKTLPLGNDEWLVISTSEESKNQAKKTAYIVNVISVLGTASQKKPKQIAQLRFESDESPRDKQNYVETTCSFLLRTMVKSKNQHTKLPQKLIFKDENLFAQVSTAFKSNRLQHFVDIDCLEEPLVMESKDVQNHVNFFKNLEQTAEIPCNDDIPGVLLNLKKESTPISNGHAPKIVLPPNFQVKLPPPPPTTLLEQTLRILFGIAVFTAIVSCFIPAPRIPRYASWPLSDPAVINLKTHLQSNFSMYGKSVDAIVDAFQFHGADKALTINLIGTSATHQKQIVQIIAEVLYGDMSSSRVKYLPKLPAQALKEDVFRHLKANPFSMIVLEYSKIPPSELSWLTSLTDDNFPFIELPNGEKANANSAVFMLLTTVDAATLYDITRGNNVEYRVKEEMKKAGWESRICQRIRHIIPLTEN